MEIAVDDAVSGGVLRAVPENGRFRLAQHDASAAIGPLALALEEPREQHIVLDRLAQCDLFFTAEVHLLELPGDVRRLLEVVLDGHAVREAAIVEPLGEKPQTLDEGLFRSGVEIERAVLVDLVALGNVHTEPRVLHGNVELHVLTDHSHLPLVLLDPYGQPGFGVGPDRDLGARVLGEETDDLNAVHFLKAKVLDDEVRSLLQHHNDVLQVFHVVRYGRQAFQANVLGLLLRF